MAAVIGQYVFDAALDYIDDNLSDIYICSAKPTTFTQATSTYALGDHNTPTCGAPTGGDGGGGSRKVTVGAVSDGDVTDDGTAAWVAGVYAGASKLLFAQELASSQAVTEGNTFSLTAFDIEFPDPTS